MAFKDNRRLKKIRTIKNLIVVCLGFLLLFAAFQALANLQSTINSAERLGVVSQSIIYAALIVSSLLLPKLVIKKLGCKWTIVLSILTYSPYIAANFYPSYITLVPTAILLGLGAAPLWSSKCTYLNQIATTYATVDNEVVGITISRFFGIFFMFFQNTQIWGNLVSYYVLKPENGTIEGNITLESCGLSFCQEDLNSTNPNLEPPTDYQRYILIGIYLTSAIIAAIVVAIFLDPLDKTDEADENDNESTLSRVVATIVHMKDANQVLLVPLTIFSGIEQAFILGDFTRAYVACAWGVYHVGFTFICFGIVDGIMSFVAGRLLKHMSRMSIMTAGCIGNVVACVIMFLWSPNPNKSYIFFIIAGIWGFSDAIWQTQINSLYGVLFQKKAEAGFANYRLWESVGFSIAFAYSSYICMGPKLYILLAFLVTGMAGYMCVEYRTRVFKSETVDVKQC